MKQYRKWSLASLLACAIFWTSCDSVSMNEVVVSAPQITSFSPERGSIGSEIVVTGAYLDDVVSATIGGEKVTILQKVSNQRLSLKVTANAKNGKIVLSNSVGQGISEGEFTLEYPAPSIAAGSMPSAVEMGNNLLLSGSYMNVVTAVLFTAEGHASGNEATIVTQSENEILVKVPYVESDNASITFRYFNGTSHVETSVASAPKVVVARYQPNVTTHTFAAAKMGDAVTLNGSYLNKIDKVLLGNLECSITLQTETELKFLIPSSDTFVDGDNTMALKISYFDGREVPVVTNTFVVRVPSVYFWENKKVYAQARIEGQLAAFFSPATGLVYANSVWGTMVDPVSLQYKANTCSAPNVPAVSEREYTSVNPYFFFSGASAGLLAINSPGNSKTQLRNFYATMESASRITDGQSIDCYGTPALTFVWLDPSKSGYRTLIDEIRNGEITKIDEATFPIDVEAKTCRGVSIASAKAAPGNDVWAPGVFTVGVSQRVDVDAFLLVFYYDHRGAGSYANVKRIGLLHIKTVDFRVAADGKTPSESAVEFDMYWQKRDYDFSKVQ